MSQANKGTSQDMLGHARTCRGLCTALTHIERDRESEDFCLRRKRSNASAERKPKLTMDHVIDMNGICRANSTGG